MFNYFATTKYIYIILYYKYICMTIRLGDACFIRNSLVIAIVSMFSFSQNLNQYKIIIARVCECVSLCA